VEDAGGLSRDEFALGAVPYNARTSALSIAMMLLAANISLPALIMGGRLGLGRGLVGTVAASFGGGMVLAVLVGLCAYAGARSGMTTYLLIVRAFGTRGGKLINLLLSCSVVGWFGVVLMLFAGTMARMAGGSLLIWAIGGTLLMASTTIVGFRALNWLSNLLLPAKLGLLIWVIWAAIRDHGATFMSAPVTNASLDSSSAISFVVGGWAVGAVVAPDFARYCREARGGALACALALGVGYPVVLVASSVPAILTGNIDLLATMAELDMGLAALTIVLLASWTGGAINLYSGSLTLATVFPRRRRSLLIWGVGLAGMGLGVAGITERLIPYLTLLSLVVPPVAGVYLPRFFFDTRRNARPAPRDWDVAAFAALVIGVGAAGVSQITGYGLTRIGPIDSLLVSAGTYLLLDLLREACGSRSQVCE
jgi:cytosine permease